MYKQMVQQIDDVAQMFHIFKKNYFDLSVIFKKAYVKSPRLKFHLALSCNVGIEEHLKKMLA